MRKFDIDLNTVATHCSVPLIMGSLENMQRYCSLAYPDLFFLCLSRRNKENGKGSVVT